LLEGGSEFVCFSSDPDKKFAILSVKVFSGTGTWSSTGGTGHGTGRGGGATLAVAQAVSKSGIPSSNFTDFTVFLLSELVGGRLELLLAFAGFLLTFGVLGVLLSFFFVPSLLYGLLTALIALVIGKPTKDADSGYTYQN
jgi:hypothetical protein